jgi:DNA-binding NarL/FixJ family response regulator
MIAGAAAAGFRLWAEISLGPPVGRRRGLLSDPARPPAGYNGIEVAMIRVLLVDDEPNVCRALCMRLGVEPDLEVVGAAGDGRTALSLALDLQPDIILMDVAMPLLDGIAATGQLRAALPGLPVIILTLHDDPATRGAAAAAGAAGFVPKHRPVEELLAAIRAAAVGA